MGPLLFPPLKIKAEKLDFSLDNVKRVYFQFFYDTKNGSNRFRLKAYAIGKKRKPAKIPPVELDIDEKSFNEKKNDFYFPKNKEATELYLGQLELSNLQLKRLVETVTSGYLIFTPREKEINPYCLVYDITDESLARTIETANPCPPARPPADDAGDT